MGAWDLFAVVAAYLLGSVSFAWLLVKRLKGIDLRTVGSGNLGATNAGRVLGPRFAILIYLLDFAKGFLPVVLVRTVGGDPRAWDVVQVALLAGAAAFLGHCFPVWHGFRGGKGVATASGVILGLTPLAALVVGAVFALMVAITKRISVGSIVGAAALPLAQLGFPEGSTPRATLWVYVAMAAVVIARHRQNLVRIARGQEPRIGRKKDATPPPAEAGKP